MSERTGMDNGLFKDLKRIDDVLGKAYDYALNVLNAIDTRPVAIAPLHRESKTLPETGIGFDAALADFEERWAPGFSASAGPRYLGFVVGGATPAAIAGDWITAAFDQNPTSGLDSSAPDLEREAIGWIRELFGLSNAHEGSFVSGATMSNLVGLAIAREWAGEARGIRVSQHGSVANAATPVLSGAAHSSVSKALSILGMGRSSLVQVPLLSGRESVDLVALEKMLAERKSESVIVVANCGTVNTVDFDDLPGIVSLKSRYSFWLHVDAAFGAFAALVPEHEHLVAGLDMADSICIDCHKWLNVPYDSAVQFSRRPDLQLAVFQNTAAYVGLPMSNPDFIHLTPENSRRLRALAAWFSLAAYGRSGHRDIVERNVAAARALGDQLFRDDRFYLIAPVRMNVVCFSLKERPEQERVEALIKRIRDAGETFLTPTFVHGVWAIRAAFSNFRTTGDDVARVYRAIRMAADDIGL